MSTSAPGQTGSRILIVEDDYFIAEDLRRSFAKVGIDVAGPVPTVEAALDLLDGSSITAAVLDINLEAAGFVFPVADALQARGIPFVFTTGYDSSAIPSNYALIKRFEKPCNPTRVLQALVGPVLP